VHGNPAEVGLSRNRGILEHGGVLHVQQGVGVHDRVELPARKRKALSVQSPECESRAHSSRPGSAPRHITPAGTGCVALHALHTFVLSALQGMW